MVVYIDYEEEEEIMNEDSFQEVEYPNDPVGITNEDNEYSYTLKIPKDRIAVLIGVKGKIKKELEDYSNARIEVDSSEGDVTINGRDALKLFELREVIKAIARGFNPELAKLLLKPDYALEIINLREFGVDSKNQLKRIRSRVIGTEGKARRTIENLTDSYISIYGKTISILGEFNSVSSAKRAIESLIKGSMHATVFKWLESQRRKAKKDQIGF